LPATTSSAPGRMGFAALGIVPTPLDAILPAYLWPYRPTGQFDAIKRSAGALRR
jgi:hypothetical protein